MSETNNGCFEPSQAVNLIIAHSTELGHKAIIDHSHWGVLYADETYQRLSFGQATRGFIKRIRADDKIDLSLQHSQHSLSTQSAKILEHLNRNGGQSKLHDKADPQLIKAQLGMSKKAFKRALGGLLKQDAVELIDQGIKLKD